MAFFIYILRCADGSYYVGSTTDVERRVALHRDGRASDHTATRRPVDLVYSEECVTLKTALKREKQIKRWTTEKKAALIAGRLGALRRLAKRVRR